jgi:tetraacyldisaccharide 4'-kinase
LFKISDIFIAANLDQNTTSNPVVRSGNLLLMNLGFIELPEFVNWQPMFRLLLLPFSFLYGMLLYCRHFLYDHGILKSVKFDVPVIVIGNLRVGGTGKTPHALYIASILNSRYKIAFLSRGYGRKSSGYQEVKKDDQADQAGDEPLLFKTAFPQVPVIVSENRVEGISQLLKTHPETEVVLLDDAFQHRKLRPGFSVLLIDWASFFSFRALLPAGNERDLWNRRKKADVLILSKAPDIRDHNAAMDEIKTRVSILSNQHLFYSHYVYDALHSFAGEPVLNSESLRKRKALLITAIADPSPLLAHLKTQCAEVHALNFTDHHLYNQSDLDHIRKIVAKFAGSELLIITTSKDRVKLEPLLNKEERANWFEQKINVLVNDASNFNHLILEYVESAKRNSKLH